MARIDFNPAGIQPAKDFEPIAPGWYAAQIVQSEIRDTKAGNGQYLYLELELLETHHPELKGRRLFDRLNIWNPNPKAVEIAQRTLSAICHAVGIPTMGDSEEAHHIPMAVKVRIRGAQGDYGPSNEIAQYDPISEHFGAAVSKPATAQPAASAPPAAQPAATPPWKR